MISKKHIAENQAVIAELTRRCVDKDEEIARLKELAAHWERGHKDLYAYSEEEIARFKALCREPVVLPLAELKKLRRFNYKFVTNGGKGDVNDAGISIYFEISEAINKKLGERV